MLMLRGDLLMLEDKILNGGGFNSYERDAFRRVKKFVGKYTSTDIKGVRLPGDAMVDTCKRFDECPASGKGHAGCYGSVGCFL